MRGDYDPRPGLSLLAALTAMDDDRADSVIAATDHVEMIQSLAVVAFMYGIRVYGTTAALGRAAELLHLDYEIEPHRPQEGHDNAQEGHE